MVRTKSIWLVAALLSVMAGLMISAARQDSATVDETTHLATGYSYLKGHRFRMTPDHPPLGQTLPALPLLFMDVRLSPVAQAILDGRLDYPWMTPWRGPLTSVNVVVPDGCQGRYVQIPPLGDVMVEWNCLMQYPADNWYYFCGTSQMLGKVLVYGSQNNGDRMLFLGRLISIAKMLLTGLLIFYFTRKATNSRWAPLIALAVWVFNPTVLAYGHLVYTDVGVTLGISVAVFLMAEFIERPNLKTAIFCGVATGIALCMKHTAVLLLPIGIVVLSVHLRKLKPLGAHSLKYFALFSIAVWLVLLAVFFPHWSPASKPTPDMAVALEIPGWFQFLRPMLIPCDYFKGLGLMLGHSQRGHGSFFLGGWSEHGWWYYFPVILVLKSPMAFVIILLCSLVGFVKQYRAVGTLERTCWLGAGTYLVLAMTSHVNIGVRHLLPIMPLFCVAIGCAFERIQLKPLRNLFLACLAWLAIIVIAVWPFYIQFFSEAVGGAANGYKYSWDSNYDWGQDANRLKQYLDQNNIRHIYLDYFGTQYSIEHLGIVNTRVNAEQARQLKTGILVVSASRLVSQEWTWLRESHTPIARVGYTLFVYRLM
jgi:hypothetical protein